MKKALETVKDRFTMALTLAMFVILQITVAVAILGGYTGVISEPTDMWTFSIIFATVNPILTWLIFSFLNRKRDEESEKRNEKILNHIEEMHDLMKELVELQKSKKKG